MTDTSINTFPTDWEEWHAQWQEWLASNVSKLQRTSLRAPGKNFLADEILGTWGINYADGSGTAVELSEVTMPNFKKGYGADRKRFVGITYVHADGTCVSGGVVESFADLERELQLHDV